MKIWSVFSVVICVHLLVIGLLLIQPGCQSRPAERPDPGMTAPTGGESYVPPAQPAQLDPAFNAGVGSASAERRDLSAPTRPAESRRSQPDTGLLEPVLEPVQDAMSLPPVTRDYTVKKGDTLSGIARQQGVSLSALLSANGLSKTSTIYVGQTLLVPDARPATVAASAQTGAAGSGKEVVVARGDTLSSIAARTGTSVRTLKALNGLTRDTIFVGQRLSIPESGTAPAPSLPAPEPVRAPTVSAGGATYTVQPGDTPGAIAKRYGITASQLMAANNISDPRKMRVGATLVIPGAAGGPSQSVSSTSSPATPVARSSQPVMTTQSSPQPLPEPTEEDPMSVLEALEDEDLPYVEVEAVEEEPQGEI